MSENRKNDRLSTGYPAFCKLCSEMWHGYLITPRLKVKPYIGNSPKVFLIGQDPTLTKRQSETVLEFDHANSRLRRYIENEILIPLDFTSEDVYATNAVKCTFPGRTPRQWAKIMGISVEDFLRPFFGRCRRYLTRELINVKPKVVIALGQPTHRLLVSTYKWKIPTSMKEVFSQAFPVHNPISTLYIPVIHYNSRRHSFYRERWAAFIQAIQEQIDVGTQKRVGTKWLRHFPKGIESINAAVSEITEAVEILKAEREEILSNEISREYPREERVRKYEVDILTLEKALWHLKEMMSEFNRSLHNGG
jgi:uracil-DNA glycosylase